jgi:fructuronate reductase
MERLCLANLARLPEQYRTGPDPAELSIGAVHLGIGAFHRAHQALYTQKAMALAHEKQWGICGVTQRSGAVVDALAPQDCLYSVLESSQTGSELQLAGAVREVLFARKQPDALTARLSSATTALVTMTVTEKGYRYNPVTRELQASDPEIVADAAGRPPETVIGQLVAGIEARMQAGGPPLSIVCCDNLPSNGATLRHLVEGYCRLLPPSRSKALASWLEVNARFPCTVVDRIVPATTDDDRAKVASLLGLEDRAAVVTEPFSQWVLEDSFAGPRPAWELAGAEVVADVGPYEEMKLRLLNGSHSALAYLGALAGYELIAEAVSAPGFATYVQDLMDLDVTPTLSPPATFDLETYKRTLIDRFANPVLRHRTVQVAMDGSQKLPYRLLETIGERLAAGAEPRHASLAVAAWMRYVSSGQSDTGRPLALEDPLAELLRPACASASGPAEVVQALLGLREVFPDRLAQDTSFRKLLVADLSSLARKGAAATVASMRAG